MANLNQMELQNLRHFIGAEALNAKKFSTYAEQCTDSELKSFLQREAQKATQSVQQLMQFLS